MSKTEYERRVVLVNPNFSDNPLKKRENFQSSIFFPNLGVDSIYTTIKSKYRDLHLYVIDGVLQNLNNEQTAEEILKHMPTIVGFSTTYINLEDSLDMARRVKKENKRITTVIGGVGAKSLWALGKDENIIGVDYCVTGDGERTFEKIIKRGKIPNKTKYIEDTIYDLDSLPFPKRKAFDTEQYIRVSQKVNLLNSDDRFLNVFTSKGCDWGKCTFCTVDRHYRARSMDKVKEELAYLTKEFRATKLFTTDDNLFTFKNPDRMYQLCEVLQEFPQLKWCVGETRVVDFSKDPSFSKSLLKKMRQSGCVEICWGIESGNYAMLKSLHKGIKPTDIETVIKLSTEAGIISKLLLMYNLPGETKESLNDTLSLVRRLISRYDINFLKVSEYINIPSSTNWYLNLQKAHMAKDILEGFRDKLTELCSQNNILIGFFDWGKQGDR